MAVDFRQGEWVSVPCRGCGNTFLRLKIEAGEHPYTCAKCGRVTKVRIRRWGEIHRIFTELIRKS